MKKSLPLLISLYASFLLAGCGGGISPPPPPADFSIVVSPSSVSTQVGGTTSPVSVSINPLNGFTGTVTVSVSGFPSGINSSPTSSFTLSVGSPQQVSFSAPAAAGTFSVAFQGTSGTLSHSVSATLTVTPPPSPYLVSASYYPWYAADAFSYTDCHNGTLRGELIPPQLPVLFFAKVGARSSGMSHLVEQVRRTAELLFNVDGAYRVELAKVFKKYHRKVDASWLKSRPDNADWSLCMISLGRPASTLPFFAKHLVANYAHSRKRSFSISIDRPIVFAW